MADREFNLLDERWLRVMDQNGAQQEVSLLTVFRDAHHFRALAGELPTQDVAVMRLLLAILHAVFSVYDVDGTVREIQSQADAYARWKSLWDAGAFREAVLSQYLEYYRDRFYLFHPERPFFQVPPPEKYTEYSAAKLNGELSQSKKKPRLFSKRTGAEKERLSYAEAARWLISLNSFDDKALKPKGEGEKLPEARFGWLGMLGVVYASGDNLFETLMLNLILLRDNGMDLWGQEQPVWEADKVKTAERTEIPFPDNLSALYTLQYRRIQLVRKEDIVNECRVLAGDFFPAENALAEPMTAWRTDKIKKEIVYTPRRHDPSRQVWRDFGGLFLQSADTVRPGIINWVSQLRRVKLIGKRQIQFKTVGVEYDGKGGSMVDLFSDSIYFSNQLLDQDVDWMNRIVNEIGYVELLVDKLGRLAENLAKASGDSNTSARCSAAKEMAYAALDGPFRDWLASIDPQTDDIDEKTDLWWKQAQQQIRALGRQLVHASGVKAFIGRQAKVGKGREKRLFTAPESYNWFLVNTSSRQALKGGKQHE